MLQFYASFDIFLAQDTITSQHLRGPLFSHNSWVTPLIMNFPWNLPLRSTMLNIHVDLYSWSAQAVVLGPKLSGNISPSLPISWKRKGVGGQISNAAQSIPFCLVSTRLHVTTWHRFKADAALRASYYDTTLDQRALVWSTILISSILDPLKNFQQPQTMKHSELSRSFIAVVLPFWGAQEPCQVCQDCLG